MLEGPTAIAFVKGDAVIAAKALRDFARTHEALVVKGGLLGDRRRSTPATSPPSPTSPPREVLLARLAGGFQAPMVKAAGLFQAFTRNMAYGIKALVDQRVEGGEALEAAAEPAADEPRRSRGRRGRRRRARRRGAAADAEPPRPPTAETEPPTTDTDRPKQPPRPHTTEGE